MGTEKERVLCVSGSRGNWSEFQVKEIIRDVVKNHKITKIVHGGCQGSPDMIADAVCVEDNIKCQVMHVEWGKYGKSAGPRRNKKMADYADELLVFWDGMSRGAKCTLDMFKERNKDVVLVKGQLFCDRTGNVEERVV